MDTRTLFVAQTFLILVTVLQYLNAQHCSPDVFQGTGVKTTTACYREHYQCSFSALQGIHPTLYNSKNTAWKQPNVTALQVTSFCKLDDHGVNQSGLDMQWKLQDVSGSQEIKGFEIRVEGQYGGDFRCVVMALNETITREKINSQFTGTVSVTRGRMFRVIVISLPRTKQSTLPHKDVKSILCDRGKSSDSWYVKICQYKYDAFKQTLNVSFEEPPKMFNITEFSIAILSPILQFYQSEIRNFTNVIFQDVKPGKYQVTMQPYDPYRYDTDRCVCRDDEARCNMCGLSICNIEISELRPTKVDDQTKDGMSLALLPVMILLFLFLGIVIFVKVIAPRCGVEIDLGYCFDTSDKPNLLCIDASGRSDMAATFQKLVHREFKNCHRSSIKYRHVTYSSDTCNSFGQLVTEVCTPKRRTSLRSDLCCRKYQGVDQNCKKVVVCLLVKELQQKLTSDIYCKLRIEMTQLPEVQCQLIVVYATCSEHHTVDKTFKLSDEKSVISGINNAIEEINNMPDGKQPNVCEINNHKNREGDLTSADFSNTIDLPEVKHDYGAQEKYYSRQNTNQLCIPENEKRGRYLSNDSGHGASPKEWSGSFNAMYEEYAVSRGGQYLMAAPEVHYFPYQQQGRCMSNDSGHCASAHKGGGSYEETGALRGRQYFADKAEMQHLPCDQRCNLDIVSWIAPSISMDGIDTCGDSVTMEFIGDELLAINEDARTVLKGKA